MKRVEEQEKKKAPEEENDDDDDEEEGDQAGWCRIGKLYLSKETAHNMVNKAIENSFIFYAGLLCEMLEGGVQPSRKLIAQVAEVWDNLEDKQKNIVKEQGLSLCYGRLWSENKKFLYSIGTGLQQFFIDQIFGELTKLHGEEAPIPALPQHKNVLPPVEMLHKNGFDLHNVK